MEYKRKIKYKKDKVHISHKIEIYPDQGAKEILDINFNYQRYLYNLGVERYKYCKKECDEIGEKFYLIGHYFFHTFLQSPRRPKRDFELNDRRLIGKIRNCSANRLTRAYENWFSNPKHYGEPTFHKKNDHYMSFELPVIKTRVGNYDTRITENNELIFPKLIIRTPTYEKVNGHCYVSEKPRFNGKPLFVTFSKYEDHYYVCFTYELDKSPYEKTNSKIVVGIDLGIKKFATMATSDKRIMSIDNQNRMKKMLYLLKKVSFYRWKMKNSKKVNNNVLTKNYFRWRKKFCQTHKKMADIRRNMLHEYTTWLTTNFGEIHIEDLWVDEMIVKKKNTFFSKDLAIACFGMFRVMLEYKCKLRGVKLFIVDHYFPSSQKCSQCGNIKPMKLGERFYECPKCGISIDRDVNASLNILTESDQITQICG